MKLEFQLPDIGEGIAEGEIVKWLVSVGDAVREHQAVVEVMTDKVTVEVPAPSDGTIAEIRAREGDVVPVGEVIFVLDKGDATLGARPAAAESKAAPPAPPASAPPASAPPASTPPAAFAPPAASAAAPLAAPAPAAAAQPTTRGKVRAVPSARRVARELGVDLAEVSGSGRGGIVRRADVEAFAAARTAGEAPPAPAPTAVTPTASPPAAPPVAIPPAEGETRQPFRGLRRKIAETMSRAKQTAPHFTVVEELDVTELVAVRAKARKIGEREGAKITYMPFVMKACAGALLRFPELNSQLDEATQEIVTYHHVNLGIATDTEQGLIVPVVRDVSRKGLLQLARELGDLAARTREGRIEPGELAGGTFTITNAGNIGGTLATPILRLPEAAILGMHRIVKRPGVIETPAGDEIAVRHYMNLSLSVDHRLIDGASAVRFLVHIKELLEHPGLLAL